MQQGLPFSRLIQHNQSKCVGSGQLRHRQTCECRRRPEFLLANKAGCATCCACEVHLVHWSWPRGLTCRSRGLFCWHVIQLFTFRKGCTAARCCYRQIKDDDSVFTPDLLSTLGTLPNRVISTLALKSVSTDGHRSGTRTPQVMVLGKLYRPG